MINLIVVNILFVYLLTGVILTGLTIISYFYPTTHVKSSLNNSIIKNKISGISKYLFYAAILAIILILWLPLILLNLFQRKDCNE
jgi:hypothetical protein